MVKIITVEREYGSLGATYAHMLANRLGWKLIDDCLIEEIAQKAGVEKSTVRQCDERLDPWFYRFGKAFWHGSLERLPIPESDTFDSERMVDHVREALEARAQEGRCVVVGRGAACLLRATPGSFHVFVHASMPRKVKWFTEQFPDQAANAEAEILATDRRRAAYIRRYYDVDWTDYRLYHLMMNNCMGFEAMVEATIAAAGLGAGESLGRQAV
jgi:cytidylate kinase